LAEHYQAKEEYAHPSFMKKVSCKQNTNDSTQRHGDNEDRPYPSEIGNSILACTPAIKNFLIAATGII
jgi:hypothetical protein